MSRPTPPAGAVARDPHWAAKMAKLRAKKPAEKTLDVELDGEVVSLTFRALPRDVYEQLAAQHPPSDDQAEKGLEYDDATFPAELVAACSVDGMTVEEARELLASWNAVESRLLFMTAVAVNQDLGRVRLGNASGPTED